MRLTGISYNPKTGVLSRNGKPITAKHRGYVYFKVDGRKLLGHRVAWYLTYGYWPKEIDHINRDKGDNRLINLRQCSRSTNVLNRSAQSNSTTGARGVYWDKRLSKYKVQYRNKHYGVFTTLEEAIARRKYVEQIRPSC